MRQLTERVVGEAAKIFQAELEERLREDLSGGADPLRFDATKRRLAEIPAGERRKMREAIRERTRAIRAGWTFETWDARMRQLYDDGRSVLALVAKLDAEVAHGGDVVEETGGEERQVA